MPHPIANIAISLVPLAADLAGRMFNIKKESKSKKDLEERLTKLENYEVEQAKLITELALKVEALQKKQKKTSVFLLISILFVILLFIAFLLVLFISPTKG